MKIKWREFGNDKLVQVESEFIKLFFYQKLDQKIDSL